jgi:signal transduction histidine kinase
MLDVSEAEEARAEKKQAHALSSRLVQVQEGERRRMARELHDEIGQTLTGLNLLLQMVNECPGARPGAAAEARALVAELMQKVRDLSLELRPSMLDDLGLLPALLSMFERYRKQTQMHVAFEHRGIEGRFEPEVETAAYRLVQEALTNAARHAQVGEVRVRVWSDGSALNLQVEDAGAGFDVGAVLSDPSHTGLLGMRERVAVLGGELALESLPGRGTCLTVQLPARAAARGAPAGEPEAASSERGGSHA